jgi:hypothetical protein
MIHMPQSRQRQLTWHFIVNKLGGPRAAAVPMLVIRPEMTLMMAFSLQSTKRPADQVTCLSLLPLQDL